MPIERKPGDEREARIQQLLQAGEYEEAWRLGKAWAEEDSKNGWPYWYQLLAFYRTVDYRRLPDLASEAKRQALIEQGYDPDGAMELVWKLALQDEPLFGAVNRYARFGSELDALRNELNEVLSHRQPPDRKYMQAKAEFLTKNYGKALEIFTELGDYRDSAEYAERCKEVLGDSAVRGLRSYTEEQRWTIHAYRSELGDDQDDYLRRRLWREHRPEMEKLEQIEKELDTFNNRTPIHGIVFHLLIFIGIIAGSIWMMTATGEAAYYGILFCALLLTVFVEAEIMDEVRLFLGAIIWGIFIFLPIFIAEKVAVYAYHMEENSSMVMSMTAYIYMAIGAVIFVVMLVQISRERARERCVEAWYHHIDTVIKPLEQNIRKELRDEYESKIPKDLIVELKPVKSARRK